MVKEPVTSKGEFQNPNSSFSKYKLNESIIIKNMEFKDFLFSACDVTAWCSELTHLTMAEFLDQNKTSLGGSCRLVVSIYGSTNMQQSRHMDQHFSN